MSEQRTRAARQQGDLWSPAGSDWAEILAPVASPVWGQVLDLARVTRGSRVLDVGCGSGDVLSQARFRGVTVSGLDPASALLEIAGDRVPEADLRQGAMEDLPFEDDAFDAVRYVNCLMYGDDRSGALREARRVLTPEGRLAVAVWMEKERNEFRFPVQALGSVLPEPPEGDGPFALSAPGALNEVLEAGGFEPIERRRNETPFTFVDDEHDLRAVLGMGPGQGILRQVDEETVTEALLDAGEEFRRDDGSYRSDNSFQVVGAVPEE